MHPTWRFARPPSESELAHMMEFGRAQKYNEVFLGIVYRVKGETMFHLLPFAEMPVNIFELHRMRRENVVYDREKRPEGSRMMYREENLLAGLPLEPKARKKEKQRILSGPIHVDWGLHIVGEQKGTKQPFQLIISPTW